jgi:signal transduction histidine kinase
MANLFFDISFHEEDVRTLIKNNNEWFVKLRYYAVVLLLCSLLGAMALLRLSSFQVYSILIISCAILVYNILISKILKNYTASQKNINCVKISLVQIILDLFQLFLIIYITGGIESPLFIFFVFHIIIGSILLPAGIIVIIAICVCGMISALGFFEYSGLIKHQHIEGLLQGNLYDRWEFLVVYLIVFYIMVFVSIYLTNKIARQLFKRERELKNAMRRIEEAEKSKQKYVTGIIHELKTPIAAIQSMLDLVILKYTGPVSPEAEEKLIRAKKRGDEAIRIINDILKISKLKLLNKIGLEKVNLNELISEILENQKASCELKNIKAEYKNKSEITKSVTGDRLLLELAFSNLIGNSVKYTPDGGKILISLEDFNAGFRIDISDNGIGIPQKDIDSVFNEFFRASNLRNRKIEGTGMGLSVVKEIVSRHGGTINVKSPSGIGNERNPGSSFIIFLPGSFS